MRGGGRGYRHKSLTARGCTERVPCAVEMQTPCARATPRARPAPVRSWPATALGSRQHECVMLILFLVVVVVGG